MDITPISIDAAGARPLAISVSALVDKSNEAGGLLLLSLGLCRASREAYTVRENGGCTTLDRPTALRFAASFQVEELSLPVASKQALSIRSSRDSDG